MSLYHVMKVRLMSIKKNIPVPFQKMTAVFVLAIMMMQYCCSAFAETITTRTEPTCTEAGQILTEDTETHVVKAETIPALGHSFGEWEKIPNSNYEERICTVCGYTERQLSESKEERAAARLELTGDMLGINKKNRVTLHAAFTGEGESFSCYAIMTLQGHSTLGLDKPNYTVRFYDDAEGKVKHKLQFMDWQKEHKYILKADYYDVTQCRNLAGARLWREVTATRENLNPRIASLPTLGAVDGFPVSVWLNGEFLGLYTLCLHKDDDLFAMEEGEQAAILICNAHTEDEAEFRAPAELDEDGIHDWEIEFCGTGEWVWAKDSFNDFISFVMHSSDEEFKAKLPAYLDVDAAIDYLIFIYTLGLRNSGVKDLVLVTFGDGWIPSAYDMDEAFGLMPKGEGSYAPDDFLPDCVNGVWTSGTDSLLWDRLLQNYEDEIRERYLELRKGPLSEQSILSVTDSLSKSIPQSLYLRDAERYPGRPTADEMMEQIHRYLNERLPALDSVLGGESK